MPKYAARHLYTCYGFAEYTSSVSSGFCDYLIDAPSRNYILGNGYRLYSPTLMRFVSADDESPFANGGNNAYCYCGGDPVNRLDGSGRSWRKALVYKRAKLILHQKKVKAQQSIPDQLEVSTQQLRALENIKMAKLSSAFKAEFRTTRSRHIDATQYAEIAPLVAYESVVNAKHAYLHRLEHRWFKPKAIGMSTRDYNIAIQARRHVQSFYFSNMTRDQRNKFSHMHRLSMRGFSQRMERLRKARDITRLELARHQ
ncbi:RHS repeat-associated core domain-containing protein [Pseudomonas fulva]|uniref:RHS repeat-associated core domain-containing protein n=1 Tax=Pseudomonas fulva TaxID=47880 RepID=UPI0034629965